MEHGIGDESEIRRVGIRTFEAVTTIDATAVSSPFLVSVMDFVFARVWTRPGLSRRDRRIVTITCVAAAAVARALDPHVFAALNSDDLTYEDMRELVLQFAVVCGWPKASNFDLVVRQQYARITEARGEAITGPSAVTGTHPTVASAGASVFKSVLGQQPVVSGSPYTDEYILGFVFAEVWKRPHLSVRERRMVSFVGAALEDAQDAVRTEVTAALRSGDLSIDELREIALQVGVYGSASKGALLDSAIREAQSESGQAK